MKAPNAKERADSTSASGNPAPETYNLCPEQEPLLQKAVENKTTPQENAEGSYRVKDSFLVFGIRVACSQILRKWLLISTIILVIMLYGFIQSGVLLNPMLLPFAVAFLVCLIRVLWATFLYFAPTLHSVFRQFSSLGNPESICRHFDTVLNGIPHIGGNVYVTSDYIVYCPKGGFFVIPTEKLYCISNYDYVEYKHHSLQILTYEIILDEYPPEDFVLSFRKKEEAIQVYNGLRRRLPWLLFSKMDTPQYDQITSHAKENYDMVCHRRIKKAIKLENDHMKR